jgi:hypothetical protein
VKGSFYCLTRKTHLLDDSLLYHITGGDGYVPKNRVLVKALCGEEFTQVGWDRLEASSYRRCCYSCLTRYAELDL